MQVIVQNTISMYSMLMLGGSGACSPKENFDHLRVNLRAL